MNKLSPGLPMVSGAPASAKKLPERQAPVREGAPDPGLTTPPRCWRPLVLSRNIGWMRCNARCCAWTRFANAATRISTGRKSWRRTSSPSTAKWWWTGARATAGELRTGTYRAPAGVDRSAQATFHRFRPARRARAGHRGNEAGQRDRRRVGRRPPLLFRGLHDGSGAGADDRGCLPRRSAFPGAGDRAAPAGGRQALPDRQLPGGVADPHDVRDPPGSARADHGRGRASVLLGGRARQEPDALPGRDARGKLADGPGERPGPWRLRRREPDRQFREHEPGEHLLEQGLQRLFEGGHRGGPLPGLRDLVGQPGDAQRRGDAVHRRRLFVGNKLAAGGITTSDGVRVDLRNIRRRWSSSAPGATTSPRRSRPSAGCWTCTTRRPSWSRQGRPSFTRFTSPSGISASSSPARSRRRSTPSSRAAWT